MDAVELVRLLTREEDRVRGARRGYGRFVGVRGVHPIHGGKSASAAGHVHKSPNG